MESKKFPELKKKVIEARGMPMARTMNLVMAFLRKVPYRAVEFTTRWDSDLRQNFRAGRVRMIAKIADEHRIEQKEKWPEKISAASVLAWLGVPATEEMKACVFDRHRAFLLRRKRVAAQKRAAYEAMKRGQRASEVEVVTK